MSFFHLISCPFTGKGIYGNGFKSQDWFEMRAEIFRTYTLKSFQNQSVKNFVVWLQFRPEEKHNPVTKKIEKYLKKSGLDYIMTFDGIMIYDDRGTEHNKDLKERMERTMKKLKSVIGKCEWVFKTDCDSDDIISRDAIKEIQQERPRPKGATYYLNGYAYDVVRDMLAYWRRPSASQIFTVIYPREIFLDAEKHLKYVKGFETHELLPLIFDATRLSDNMYACITHGINISTTWNCPFRKEEIFGEEKINILKKFGLYYEF